MARRRRRSRGGLPDGVTGVLLGLLALLIISGIGGGYWYVRRTRPILNAETNCPTTGPTGIHVILFDRSDPISDQQAQRIRQVIVKYKEAASSGVRFDLYTFSGDTSHVLSPRLQVCAVGKEANELIENPERVRQRYEKKFSEVLDQTVGELLRGSKEDKSPIIESIRAAAITSFGAVEPSQIPLRLTLISDMVQNTNLYSNFQTEPNFQQLSRNPAWPTLQPQLKGAEVDIIYLLRLSATRKGVQIQNRGHQAFWEQLIAASGGRLMSIDPY
jgi:hypothetical protein